jgi:hypothetical protein
MPWHRLSAIDGRTIRHCGYEVSQQKRKRVEEPFGWGKTIGGLARPMLRGVKKLVAFEANDVDFIADNLNSVIHGCQKLRGAAGSAMEASRCCCGFQSVPNATRGG